jgi:hypothetical protein
LKRFLDHKISVCICTDNRTFSNTNVTKELALAVSTFHMNSRVVKDVVTGSFKRCGWDRTVVAVVMGGEKVTPPEFCRSFYPGPYLAKRGYVRQVIDYYEAMEYKFGLKPMSPQPTPVPVKPSHASILTSALPAEQLAPPLPAEEEDGFDADDQEDADDLEGELEGDDEQEQ